MPCPVSTWMGDHVRAGKPSRYVASLRATGIIRRIR